MGIKRYNDPLGRSFAALYIESGTTQDAIEVTGTAGRVTADSSTITNVDTKTYFDETITIPVALFTRGKTWRFKAAGRCPSTNSTDTLIITLEVGDLVVATTATVDVADDDIFCIDATLVADVVGASGTAIATGAHVLDASGTVPTLFSVAGSLDSSADVVVRCSATWSAASASNQVALTALTVAVD